jgi:hypothetical protein
MPFNVLAIRDAADGDGRVWPVLPAQPDGMLVAHEDLDGERIVRLPVSSVAVLEVTGGGQRTVFASSDLAGTLYVTDGRVVFASANFDKGSTWVGFGGIGLAVALTATAVSKTRAASRRRGKILTGQVRYPWLSSVHAHPRSGRGSREKLRLGFATCDEQGSWIPYLLDVTLPAGTFSALQAAQDIARRAAAFRLAHYSPAEGQRVALIELASAPVLAPPAAGQFAGYVMPGSSAVGGSTAYPPGYLPAQAN